MKVLMIEEKKVLPSSGNKPVLLVDGSNVAFGGGKSTTPKLQNLEHVLEQLMGFPIQVITIVDAKLRHSVDQQERLEELINSDKVLQAPAGRSADDFLLQLALRRQSKGDSVYILTNDMFPVKEAGGVIPRIAFIMAPINDDTEILFSPPIESLIESVQEEAFAPPPEAVTSQSTRLIPEKPIEVPLELLKAFLNFITTQQPPLKVGDRLAFAKIAGHLHNQFDGDFCSYFGYAKPKDFAQTVEKMGYVSLRREGAPLYFEFQKKLFDEIQISETDTEEQPRIVMPFGNTEGKEIEMLRLIIESLKQEHHYPTEEKIIKKFRSSFPNSLFQPKALIDKGLESKFLTRERLGNSVNYWPTSGRWEAIDPDDHTDPYTPEMWKSFQEALARLPGSQRIAQTRYYLAKNLGNFGDSTLQGLPQAKREHMVQLAVSKKLLNLVPTLMGIRISVPIGE